MHAYQQQLYGTLDDIYSGVDKTGGSNMEFEEKAFNIMSDVLAEVSEPGENGLSVGLKQVYEDQEALDLWLSELMINHPTGPIALNQSEKDGWFEALEEFQQYHETHNPDLHYADPIDYNQEPDAILNLINKTFESNCN